MKERFRVTGEHYRTVIIILLGVLAVIWMIPFIGTGVVNNDELMRHLNVVYEPLLRERSFEQGRVLGYYLKYPFRSLFYFSVNFYLFKIRDFSFIILSLVSLSVLYYKLFHKFSFSCLTACIGLAFMPVTFEHTLPQAYCECAIYASIIIGAVLLFIQWLEKGKKGYLLTSLFVNFYMLFCYEIFIVLMPIYAVAAWHTLPKERKNIRNIVCAVKYHIGISVLYLMVYTGMRYFFPSSYDGNSFGSLSVVSIFRVLKQLILASLPGYYCLNAKYRYIFREFSNYEAILSGGGVKAVIVRNADLGVVCFGIILFVALVMVLNNVHIFEMRNTNCGVAATIGISMGFVVLPLLPFAISVRYQSLVNASNYISVTAVYFSYLAVVFLISYLVWEITVRLGKKATFILLTVIVLSSMGIQMMNHVIESRQEETANRVKMIEEVFKTDIVGRLEEMEVDATDLYETIDALGFENDEVTDGYWTLFSRYYGHDITLKSKSDGSIASMFYKKEKQGGLVGIRIDSSYYVLTTERQADPKAVKIGDNQYMIASFNQYTIDHGMYIYAYIIVGDRLLPVKDNDMVGGTWREAVKLANIYEDGFIGTDGDFIIRTGDTGKITIKLYCPFEMTGEEWYRIFVNGQEIVWARAVSGVSEQVIRTTLQNQLVVVHIETNFAQQPDNGDVRELSMLISDVYTE